MLNRITVTVPLEGRDHGKQFVITELPAFRAEDWAMRAMSLAGRSGVNLTPDLLTGGIAAITWTMVQALVMIDFVQARPLMGEMMSTIQFMPNPANPDILRPAGKFEAEDIVEADTPMFLRKEWFKLHKRFFTSALIQYLSNLKEMTMAMEEMAADALESMPNT